MAKKQSTEQRVQWLIEKFLHEDRDALAKKITTLRRLEFLGLPGAFGEEKLYADTRAKSLATLTRRIIGTIREVL